MEKIVYLTPDIAVTGALDGDGIRYAAAAGFRAIINNRPDGEDGDQLPAREAAQIAATAGLVYRHVPASKHELFTDAVVEPMSAALADLPRPLLAHCKSGLRSAIAWAAASARERPVAEILEQLAKAGFDLDFLRDDLEAQANRRVWQSEATEAVAQRA